MVNDEKKHPQERTHLNGRAPWERGDRGEILAAMRWCHDYSYHFSLTLEKFDNGKNNRNTLE